MNFVETRTRTLIMKIQLQKVRTQCVCYGLRTCAVCCLSCEMWTPCQYLLPALRSSSPLSIVFTPFESWDHTRDRTTHIVWGQKLASPHSYHIIRAQTTVRN